MLACSAVLFVALISLPRYGDVLCVAESASTVLVLFFVSPVLMSLTQPWSDDTLTALCCVVLLVHVVTSDYSAGGEMRDAPVSASASSFASILLASRLEKDVDAFAVIMTSVVVFSVSQGPRRALRVSSPKGHILLTAAMSTAASLWLLDTAPPIGVCYISVVVVFTFVVPLWYRHAQMRLKLQISGPWDEARPTNSAAAEEWATAGLMGA